MRFKVTVANGSVIRLLTCQKYCNSSPLSTFKMKATVENAVVPLAVDDCLVALLASSLSRLMLNSHLSLLLLLLSEEEGDMGDIRGAMVGAGG